MFAVEIMKVPLAVHHYFDHEATDHPGLTFIGYLYEHYVQGQHDHPGDEHCAENLPFKHCGDCCSHHAVVIPFTLPAERLNQPGILEKSVQLPVIPVEAFISTFSGSIWQPPKID